MLTRPRHIARSEIVGLGETQHIEFKRSGSLYKEALADLCAMVNSALGQGTVVFGIEPSGTIVGLQHTNLDTLQKTISTYAKQKLDPPLQIEIESAISEEKHILLLSAKRNRSVAFHEYDGRAYIREGSTSRQLSVAEKQHLNVSRNRDLHNGPWRCNKCGTIATTISGLIITDSVPRKDYSHGCGGEWWPAT